MVGLTRGSTSGRAILVLTGLAAGLAVLLWQQDPQVRYLTATADQGAIVTEVTASGTVNAVISTEVSSQLSGQVAQLLADFNDPVQQRQPLARLDSQSYAASVREAEADLEMAVAELRMGEAAVERVRAELGNARALRAVAEGEADSARAKHAKAELDINQSEALRAKQMISTSDAEQARTQHESTAALLRAAEAQLLVRDSAIQAAEAALRIAEAEVIHHRAVVRRKQAALDRARIDLDRTEIQSPIDGVVIRRSVELGQTVAASLQAPTLFTIAQDLREMRVEVKVDEADIGLIREGQPVTFTVDAYPGRRFNGSVEQIRKAHEVFQNVVTYTVIVSAENADLALFPGTTAVVRIVVDQLVGVLRVPNEALRYKPKTVEVPRRDSRQTLWMLSDAGVPTAATVTAGPTDSRRTAILAGGLAVGDVVITGEIHEGPAGIGERLTGLMRDLRRGIVRLQTWLSEQIGVLAARR